VGHVKILFSGPVRWAEVEFFTRQMLTEQLQALKPGPHTNKCTLFPTQIPGRLREATRRGAHCSPPTSQTMVTR
jgi:hypothetical protein